MLDPLPAPPVLLSALIKPLAHGLSLPSLPLHIHEVVLAFTFYYYLHRSIAPRLSQALIPDIYEKFNARTKINWNVHIVSFVQSCVVNTAALWVIFSDTQREHLDWEGRVWGYTGATGLIQALALGYFAWDLYMCARYVGIFGWGMLAHGASAVAVFSLGFRPFVNYYAPVFILYELSSPFLNIHWALDKLGLTGSKYQLVNGIFLMTTFFCCRLLWGTYNSVLVFHDIWTAMQHQPGTIAVNDPFVETVGASAKALRADAEVMRFAEHASVPMWLALTYLGSNLVLNGLNWYWFSKMVQTIRKRFEPGAAQQGGRHDKPDQAVAQGTAIDIDGDANLKRRA